MLYALSTSSCVCGGVGNNVCVCVYKEETLLQRVQIYLYANWILVKRFGVPHGLSPLVKWGRS